MLVRTRFIRGAAALVGLLLVAAACVLPGGQKAGAPLDPKRLFATSRPGTVMVLADFKAHLTVPNANVDDARLSYLENKAEQMVADGQLSGDTNTIETWFIDQVLSDPLSYFVPTQDVRQTDEELIAQGSGFVISPQGYIVTNAHVATPNEDELRHQLSSTGLKDWIDHDVKDFLSGLSAQGWPTTPDLTAKVTQAYTSFDTKYLQITKLDKAFFVEVGASIPGVEVGAKSITAEVSAAGREIPGKDVAILKVERTDMPTVPLGDDSQVQPGDRVYVLGYPYPATFHPVLSNESQIEPTMTTGTVSAKKTMPGGFSVLQIDASITHGNSGGPVFDSTGRVIGIATFGTLDDNGNQVQGFNFAIPISVAQEFIGKAGAHPTEGLVSQKFNDAVDLYDRHWYADALTEFQQVNSLSPGHPYVQEYITNSETAIAQGRDRSNEKYLPFLFVGAPLVLLLLGGGTAIVIVLLGRRRRSPPAPLAAQSGPAVLAYAGQAAGSGYPHGWDGQPTTAAATAAPSPAPNPAALQARYCSGCGNEVSGKAFCDRCGQRTGNQRTT